MTRSEWIARGVLLMAVFGIFGQGCCGRRHKPPKDAAQVTATATAAEAPSPTTNY